MTEIWNDGAYRKVIKRELSRGGFKYYITDLENSIEIYEDDMLSMCKAVINNARPTYDDICTNCGLTRDECTCLGQ